MKDDSSAMFNASFTDDNSQSETDATAASIAGDRQQPPSSLALASGASGPFGGGGAQPAQNLTGFDFSGFV